MLDESNNTVTFADVAGCDEAKEEVSELVDFLRDPSKFQKLGGRIPKGVLMVGSPGTGKTLLAKAIAGEAKVPFFSIRFRFRRDVRRRRRGPRPRHVRERQEARPCIIFIDELDAVGRQRGAGLGGGNDEREQTLNQMLVEMDGFEGGQGIIVIAATNRPDVLDPALMRPGRFDRQVVVPLPDIRGREQILTVHAQGADCRRRQGRHHRPRHAGFLRCRPRQPGQRGRPVRRAHQQAPGRHGGLREGQGQDHDGCRAPQHGHERGREEEHRLPRVGPCVVAKLMPKSDPVHKVTIIPRGARSGLTMQLPVEDRYAYDRTYLMSRIAVLFGGRIAEELFMNQMTTGASNDFERATQMARDMVTRYGMSDALGPMVYGENEGKVFLGRSITTHKNVSGSDDAEGRRRNPPHHRPAVRWRASCSRRTATRSRP